MDCYSVPGVLLCLAVFLAAKGLSEAQLGKCVKVVKKLESCPDLDSLSFDPQCPQKLHFHLKEHVRIVVDQRVFYRQWHLLEQVPQRQ